MSDKPMLDESAHHKNQRAELARRIVWLLALVLTVVVIGTVVALVVSIRNTQIEGTPLGKEIQKSNERIMSCTTPGGKCYEDGNKRSATFIASINTVTIYAVTCVRDNPTGTVKDIQTCVTDLLDADK